MRRSNKTKPELLLEVLSDGEWHWADELAVRVGWPLGDTVLKARNKGYAIITQRVGLKHQYKLPRI